MSASTHSSLLPDCARNVLNHSLALHCATLVKVICAPAVSQSKPSSEGWNEKWILYLNRWVSEGSTV